MPRDVNGSFWQVSLPPAAPRAALEGTRTADVCVVGAGFTGLWTAYWLLRGSPGMSVVVLEREHVGFGASGRNGGWLTAALPGLAQRYTAEAGREATLAFEGAMAATVDDVITVATEEDIDADIHKGGQLRVAVSAEQDRRLRAAAATPGPSGQHEERYVDAAEVAARVRVAGAHGALHSPHCARLQPMKLARGLAAAVERRGGVVLERSGVVRAGGGVAATGAGEVRAGVVVRATEAYAAEDGGARDVLPVHSAVIATAPLPTSFWDAVGWDGAETMSDAGHDYAYLQRTADDRIVIGGGGAPLYRFGSRTATGPTEQAVRTLERRLQELFPALAPVRAAHAWSGVLAAPRDWCGSVAYDPGAGLAHAGGYVGHGVAAAALAGRTLAELILGERSARTALPWVGRRSPTWEPEPLRWLGVRLVDAALRAADRHEQDRTTGTVRGRLAARAAGLAGF